MSNLLTFKRVRLIFCTLVVILCLFSVGYNSAHALSDHDVQNSTILAEQGWKFLVQGGTHNYAKAEELFQKAISLDSRNAEAYAGLGCIIRMRGYISRFKFDKDACRKALSFIEKAIQLDAWNSRAHYNKGEVLLCLENYDGALREGQMLEGTGYKGCLTHLIKARAYKGKMKRKKNSSDRQMAIFEATDYLECSQKAASANQTDEALKLLEEILVTTKDYDSTVEYFKSNIESMPDTGSSYTNYVWILLLRNAEGDLDEAERTVKKAKDVVNNEIVLSVIHNMRGDKYVAQGQYERARDQYIQCLVENPREQNAKHKMANICSQLGDMNCIKTWRKLIQAYLDHGNCDIATKEFEVFSIGYPQALEPLKEAVSHCEEKGKKKARTR
jgi:tetratricopeptide (TPR) repeat protein